MTKKKEPILHCLDVEIGSFFSGKLKGEDGDQRYNIINIMLYLSVSNKQSVHQSTSCNIYAGG